MKKSRLIATSISPNQPAVKIGEAAKILGISIDTLRRWERSGRINSIRTPKGTRLYETNFLNKMAPSMSSTNLTPLSVEQLLEQSKAGALKKYWEQTADMSVPNLKPQPETISKPIVISYRNLFLIMGAGIIFAGLITVSALIYYSKYGISVNQVLSRQKLSQPQAQVLGANTTPALIKINANTIISKSLTVDNQINGLKISGSDNSTLNVSTAIKLDQDLSTASSPTFAGLTVNSPINAPEANTKNLTLTSAKDQVTFDLSGVKSTLTWSPSSAKTLTLPDITDTLVGKTTTDTLSNKTIKSADSNTISGSFPDITGITSLGTVATGVWNGTKIAIGYGGTSLTTYTKGDVIYSSASDTLAKLTIGTEGQVLKVSSGGIPEWGSAAADLTLATGSLTTGKGGTNITTYTTGDMLYASATDTLSKLTVGSSGQVLGITSGVPTWTNLSSGAVTSVNSSAGAITIAAGGVNALSGSGGAITITGTEADTFNTVTTRGATTTAGLTIAPTGDSVTSLTLKGTSGSGSPNILNVTSSDGLSNYLSISSVGALTVGGNTFTTTGSLEAGGKIQLTGMDNAVLGTAVAGGWTMNSNTFTYRRGITVTNNDGSNSLPTNYQVTVSISGSNASQIYSNSQADYDDVRVSFGSTEIAKNVTSFTSSSIIFTFQLQSSIAASGSDATYYLYYGNSSLASAGSTYTGDIQIETADDASTWTSADTSQFPISTETTSPAPQEGTGSVQFDATVDNMGTFSSTGQTALDQTRTNFGFATTSISGTTYLYAAGGSSDGTAGNALNTVYKTSVASANGNVAAGAASANTLSAAVMDNTAVVAAPALDTGTGSDGALNLSDTDPDTSACSSWDGTTCTINLTEDVQTTLNFTTINIDSGKTLTFNGPHVSTTGYYMPVLKATGAVTISGTVNLNSKGYYGGNPDTSGRGPGGGGRMAGGGYGGAGGANAYNCCGLGFAGPTYDTSEVGSSGGGGAGTYGGHGGGSIQISAGGDISINTITANGGNGGGPSTTGGGGGSGGRITIKTSGSITVSGSITANGGTGGQGSNAGGSGGGGGRITLQDSDGTISGTITASAGNPYGFGGYGVVGSAGVVTKTSAIPYLYSLGGKNTSGTAQSGISLATLSTTDGSVGAFSASAVSLPQALFGHVSTVLNISSTNYLYILGGNNGTSDQTTVYKGTFNSDGTIAAISSTSQTQLTTGVSYPAITSGTISSTPYLWVLGGLNGSTAQTTVYKGTFDGSGNLTLTTTDQSTLPQGLYAHSAYMATVGSINYMYIVGGMTTGGTKQTTVYRATIDASGNVGTFATTSQTQLSTAIANGGAFNFTDGSSNQYAYIVGGNTGTVQSAITKSKYTPIDQTAYSFSKTLSSSVNLSNKNDLQFKVYSSRTGSYMNLQFYDATGGWQTCTFSVSSANTWETKTCDITGVSSVNKDAVSQLKLAVSSSGTTAWTAYLDDIDGVMNASTVSNTASGGSALMGAANLDLNAQGTGMIRFNYDGTNSFAGTGGLNLYNGGTTSIFSVDGSGNVVGTGTTGITLSGNGAGLTFSGTGTHSISASSGTLSLSSPTINTATIAGGTINNAVIGGSTAAAGTFTTLAGTASLAIGAASNFAVNSSGDVTSVLSTLDGTSTTDGTGTTATSLILAASGGTNFDVGNYIKLESSNCVTGVNVCYAKITAKSTDTLTISPALTWISGATVTEVHIPEIGATDTASTLANRFGRGYFIDGVVTGNDSTSYTDGSVTTNKTTFNLLNNTATTLNIGGDATTISIGATGGTTTINGGLAVTGTLSGTLSGSGPTSGTSGHWSRSGTTLSTAISGDSITTSGSISTSGSGSITAGGNLSTGGSLFLTSSSSTTVGTNVSGGWTMNSNTYNYRRIITITNNDGSNTLPQNYQVTLTLTGADATEVCGSTQSDSDDIRIAYNSSEIARNITRTCDTTVTVSFQLQASIDPSGSSNVYYLYYGNSALTAGSTYTYASTQLDSADTVANWTSSNGTQLVLSQETTIKQEGTGSVKAVATSLEAGTGADGAVTFSSNTDINAVNTITGRSCADGGDGVNYSVTSSVAAAATTITLSSTPSAGCLAANDEVLIVNLMGTSGDNSNVGKFEVATISSISSDTITLTSGLTNAYDGTTQKIMVQRIPNYTDVTVNGSVTLTGSDFDGTKGGILFFRATGTVTVTGSINMNGKGFRGGAAVTGSGAGGKSGESVPGAGSTSTSNNSGGGGGGGYGGGSSSAGGGAGGGYGATATAGQTGSPGAGGTAGASYGGATLSTLYLGSGGGSGGGNGSYASGAGGDGGGIVAIGANTLTITGTISADGDIGSNNGNAGSTAGAGGGGSGGSIKLNGTTVTLGTALTTAAGGGGATRYMDGGAGSVGIIAVSGSATGTTSPTYGASSALAVSATYYATRTIDATDISSKGGLQVKVYSSLTGSYSGIEFSEDGSTWQTCNITVSSADTWETKNCDISGITGTSRDAVTQIRMKYAVAGTSYTYYFDDINAIPSSFGGSDPTVSIASRILGASNLNLNAQGSGAVLLNYDATTALAGTGGLTLYNGSTTAIFTIDSNSNVVIGTGAVATTASNGFLYMTTSAGLPTGTPTTYTGRSAVEFDTTNNKLCAYNTTGTPGWKCSGALSDWAEWAPAKDTESGDVVSIASASAQVNDDNFMLEKSSTSYDQKIFGVVSKYAEEANSANGYKKSADYHAIALAGRVPVKVSTQSGTIRAGDYLTSSFVPGVAMKATRPGIVIGKALEDYAGSGIGKILSLINISYADPLNFLSSLSMDNEGNLIIPKIKVSSLSMGPEATSSGSLSLTSGNTSVSLSSSTPDTPISNPQPTNPNDQYYDLGGKVASLEERISTLEHELSQVKIVNSPTEIATLSAEIASPSANIATPSANTSPSAALASSECNLNPDLCNLQLTSPDILLATGSATLANITVLSQATMSGQLTAYDLTVQNNFRSLGETTLAKTNVAGDLTIDGTLSIINGNTINSIGTLYLQNSPLSQQIDFFNGQAKIDKSGKLSIQKLAISSKTLGTGVIFTGQNTVIIENNNLTPNSKVFVTVHQPVSVGVINIDQINKTFTVQIDSILSQNVIFDWWIVDSE